MWMITYCSSLKRTYLTLYCTCHNIIQEKECRRRWWPCPHGRDVQHLVQSATSTMQLPKRYIFLTLTCFRISPFYQKLCHILKGEDGWTIEQSFLRSPPNLLNWCAAGVRHTNLHSFFCNWIFFFAIGPVEYCPLIPFPETNRSANIGCTPSAQENASLKLIEYECQASWDSDFFISSYFLFTWCGQAHQGERALVVWTSTSCCCPHLHKTRPQAWERPLLGAEKLGTEECRVER